MSTPISQIPSNAAPSSAPPVSDPEVLNVLQEMEAEVAKATQAMPPSHTPHHPSMHMQHMHMPMPTMTPIPLHKESKGWVDTSLLQDAAIAAVVATIIFYPPTLKFLYARLPAFEGLFESYDFIIRFVVLFAAMYFLLMKLKN